MEKKMENQIESGILFRVLLRQGLLEGQGELVSRRTMRIIRHIMWLTGVRLDSKCTC